MANIEKRLELLRLEMNMSTNPAGPVPVAATTSGDNAATPPKLKPTKTIPTDRINPAKQLDILRAYAAASNNGTRPATVNEVAEIVKMAPTTVSTANAFLNSIGLIQRSDAGAYMPSAEALAFLRAYEWNPETASHKLGSTLKDSWFGIAILPRITFGPIDEEQAVGLLADAATAGPEYKKELRAILDFLVLSGLILREGGQIKMAKTAAVQEPSIGPKLEPKPHAEQETRAPGKNVNTALRSTGGGVTFNVDVSVDMAEFATWRPERIQAFFRGIAEVLAAKADVEKGGPAL